MVLKKYFPSVMYYFIKNYIRPDKHLSSHDVAVQNLLGIEFLTKSVKFSLFK